MQVETQAFTDFIVESVYKSEMMLVRTLFHFVAKP